MNIEEERVFLPIQFKKPIKSTNSQAQLKEG